MSTQGKCEYVLSTDTHMHYWQQQQPREISHFKGFPSSYTATNVEINSAEEEEKWENGHSPFAEKKTQIPPSPPLDRLHIVSLLENGFQGGLCLLCLGLPQ